MPEESRSIPPQLRSLLCWWRLLLQQQALQMHAEWVDDADAVWSCASKGTVQDLPSHEEVPAEGGQAKLFSVQSLSPVLGIHTVERYSSSKTQTASAEVGTAGENPHAHLQGAFGQQPSLAVAELFLQSCTAQWKLECKICCCLSKLAVSMTLLSKLEGTHGLQLFLGGWTQGLTWQILMPTFSRGPTESIIPYCCSRPH